MLSLKGISVGYGGKTVVSDIAFDVSPGEFCALLGLNGSGKTTLLKAVCGLLPMTSGQCLVDGADVALLKEHSRAKYISYLPQRLSTLRGVSVLDTVMMGFNASFGALEFPSAKDRDTALNTLEMAGIGHLAYQDFSKLSEGQKQMAALARTLVQNTPVMLMDEPDSALDFLNRHKLMGKFRSLIHGGRKAALITLHDPNLALNYCDRIVLISGGKKVSDLFLHGAAPADIRTSISLIYGDITLLEHGGNYTVVPSGEQKLSKSASF